MKIETCRIIADWLEHATYGVNAMLDTVPLAGADVVPDDVTVFNAADDKMAALRQIPTDATELPALVVMLEPSAIEQAFPANQPFPPDAQVDVLIRYEAKDSTTQKAVRDESYTTRAIWRSIGQLMNTSAGNTARSRNSIQLYGIVGMRALTLDAPTQDAVMSGGVMLSLRVRDIYAHGA